MQGWKECKNFKATDILDPFKTKYAQDIKQLPQKNLDLLFKNRRHALLCSKIPLSDATTKLMLSQMLINVCSIFSRDVVISCYEIISGRYIRVKCPIDFILTKGNKKILVIHPKNENFRHASIDALLGSEIIADLQ